MARVVFVDVGGTLWPNAWPALQGDRQERIARLCSTAPRLLAAQAAEFVDALSAVDHPLSARQQTGRLVEEIAQRHGVDDLVSVDAEINAMCLPARGRVELFPGARELLAGLADRALRVVIVSNVLWRCARAQRDDFEDSGVASYVADYVMSIDVGWRKPHPRFFDAALSAGGVQPDRCAIVGDSEPNDIEPGCARGMVAVRVAIEGRLPRTSAAAHICGSLDEAADFLLHWAVRPAP
jgi:HAD superfamily hydrolase (TIGR01509 family)